MCNKITQNNIMFAEHADVKIMAAVIVKCLHECEVRLQLRLQYGKPNSINNTNSCQIVIPQSSRKQKIRDTLHHEASRKYNQNIFTRACRS